MERSEKKKRARRPRSSHNRARSASRDRDRDRRTPEVDFDLNSEYFDSIATSGQAEGRTSRSQNHTSKRGLHRAKSQGATPRNRDRNRESNDQKHDRNVEYQSQGRGDHRIQRQNSQNESNKLQKYRQRSKRDDDYEPGTSKIRISV